MSPNLNNFHGIETLSETPCDILSLQAKQQGRILSECDMIRVQVRPWLSLLVGAVAASVAEEAAAAGSVAVERFEGSLRSRELVCRE
jgi:hypothetical protein